MTFKIEQIPVGKMANFTYLIIDNEEKEIAPAGVGATPPREIRAAHHRQRREAKA